MKSVTRDMLTTGTAAAQWPYFANPEHPYTCTGCGYAHGHVPGSRPDVTREQLEADGIPLWKVCPDEGPEVCDLTDPAQPNRWRERTLIFHQGRTIRVCSPFVVLARDDERISCGPALSADAIQRELHAREVLKNGAERGIDLGLLAGVSFRDQSVRRRASGCFELRWHTYFQTSSQWHIKVQCLRCSRAVVENVVKAYFGEMGPFHDFTKATLLVPFDLRFGLDEQLGAIRKTLQEIQHYALRLAGRERPLLRDSDAMWRDVYCYLLHEEGKKTYRLIAQEVFTKEASTERGIVAATSKVRSVVAKVRKAVTRPPDKTPTPP